MSITTVENPARHLWTYAVAWSDTDNSENSRMADQASNNEDLAVTSMEIYVR